MSSANCLLGDNLQLLCSAAAKASGVPRFSEKEYRLVIRQQPERSRVGSISEKVDRRPIDPPPIIQLVVHDPLDPFLQSYTTSPAFIMQAVLMDESGKTTLRHIKGHRAMAMSGSMVSPLHTLRDTSMAQGAYFVFSDLSVRMEGSFRLRFELFETSGDMVHSRASTTSDVFCVYSPKRFPGMMESTRLSKTFAEQGLRIRIRTEAGTKKRGRKQTAPSQQSKKAKTSGSYMLSNDILGVSHTAGNVSISPITSNFASNMLGSAGNARAAGFMAFRQEPLFSNHSQGTTAADQPRFDPEHAAKSRLYDATTPGHGLDLDDIAAVALLDSLSNNGAIKQHVPHAFQSSTSYAQILPPIGCGSISTATSGAMLPAGSMSINIENELQSLPGDMQTRKQHSSYNTMGNMPFSNYHITSTHTFDNERHNRSQDSLSFEQNLLFGLSQRPNSMLRTNNEFGLQSPIAQTSAPTETYILQAPQRLYTSQTRGTVMDSNGVGTNSIVHQTSNLPKHSWSSSLPGINIPFPQNGFATSNIRSDFPGALL